MVAGNQKVSVGLALETVGLGRQVKPKTGKVWNLVNQDLIFQKGLQELALKICCVCSEKSGLVQE